jgi:hypothetical protein
VLDGRARHSGGRIPFYALVDALDDHLAGLDFGGVCGRPRRAWFDLPVAPAPYCPH